MLQVKKQHAMTHRPAMPGACARSGPTHGCRLSLLTAVAIASMFRVMPAAASDPLHAQGLTQTQSTQIQALFQDIDARIAAEIERDPRSRQSMQSRLAGIERMDAGVQRRNAIAQYHDQYREYYRRLLQQADVDLVQVGAQLKAIVGDGVAVASGDHGLIMRIQRSRSARASTPQLPPNATILPVQGIAFERGNHCGFGNTGTSASSASGIAASARTNVGGECTMEAGARAQIGLPRGTEAGWLQADAKTGGQLLATARLASSATKAEVLLAANCTDAVGRRSNEAERETVILMVPLLWVAEATIGNPNPREVSKTTLDPVYLEQGSSCALDARVAVSTLSRFASGVRSDAHLNELSVKLAVPNR